jgi:hypothetical protein
MTKTCLAFFLAAATCTGMAAAQALVAQTSGITNANQVFDFGANLFPNFTPVSTQFAGLSVSHAAYFTTGISNNLVGGFLTNDFSGAPDTVRLTFASPVTDVSFVYHQVGAGTSTVRALLAGVVVASFSGSWNQSQPNNYFGFTNTVCDSIEIDFVVDFNLDTVAVHDPSLPIPAACVAYNGSGVNPVGFSCTTLPVLGTTWLGTVATTPATLVTALAYAPAGIAPALPAFGGELLVQPAGLLLFTSGGSYSLAIPATASWLGTVLAFQGLRLDLVGGSPTIVPLNAQELVLGV